MTEFILAFFVFATFIIAMAVGVIFSNKPIKGSCGGLSALGMKEGCEICGGKPEICEENQKIENTKKSKKKIFYDAVK